VPDDDKAIWHDRYRSIANLERHLHVNGTRIVKFYLHLSKEEQRKRFLARIDAPEKNWKFSLADIRSGSTGSTIWRRMRNALVRQALATRPGMSFRRRQRERSADRIPNHPRYLEGLEMSYPKTTDERRQELLEIRKQLTN